MKSSDYSDHHRQQCQRVLPKRIILVRHGESKGNTDDSAYATTPDHKIPLTPEGVQQAKRAGSRIRQLVSDGGVSSTWKTYFYVSPYERTRSTLREIGRAFPKKRVIGVREECRVREQDFGNFQIAERMKVIKETRERFGRFFYRFPEGESAADVYDRVSSFLESLWRDIDMNRLHHDPPNELNLIIVSHGLALRVFLTKWFKWTVEQFEYPATCLLQSILVCLITILPQLVARIPSSSLERAERVHERGYKGIRNSFSHLRPRFSPYSFSSEAFRIDTAHNLAKHIGKMKEE